MKNKIEKLKPPQRRPTRSFWRGLQDNMRTGYSMYKAFTSPVASARLAFNVANGMYNYGNADVSNEISDEIRAHARYANSAYVPWGERADELNDSTYRKELSNDEISVYTGKNGQHHISVRGTIPGGSDFSDDAAILSGGFDQGHSRVRDVLELIDELGADPQNSTLYGHSLGGSIATLASKATGIKSHNFNTGSSPFRSFDDENAHHYLVTGDPVSNTALGNIDSSRYTLFSRPKPDMNAHAIEQFM